MEKKSCFIIMPFSQVKIANYEYDKHELDYIYEHIIKKAVHEYIEKDEKIFSDITRYNSKVGSIINGITRNLNETDLVIADLTGLNSNVMYELGVRHSLRRGTIIITQDLSALPSDLRDYFCIGYKYSRDTIEQLENYNSFKTELHKSISELFTTDKFDSPILNYLEGKQKYWKEDEISKLKENFVIIQYILTQYDVIQEIINGLDKVNIDDAFFIINSLINNLNSAIHDLKISYQTTILYENIQAAKSLIMDVSKSSSMIEQLFRIEENDSNKNLKAKIKDFLDSKFINYFKLNDEEIGLVSFKEIFSDKGDFYLWFLEELEEYIERKAKELGLDEEEFDKILEN
ncbi:MAG TPA: hypothetical protein PLD02_03800 [Saprospiraceae bacterium]|nr:hypothetical protein [Saprospiraceae bacterium]